MERMIVEILSILLGDPLKSPVLLEAKSLQRTPNLVIQGKTLA
jgi:hypothetical protein